MIVKDEARLPKPELKWKLDFVLSISRYRVSRADVIGNKQVQTIAAEVLSLLLSELVVIGNL